MKKLVNFALVAILIALCSTWALATTINPIEGASILVGDKLFSNFGITGADPLSVSIAPLIGPGVGVYGIQINGPFFASAGKMVDFAFTYTVEVVPPTNPAMIVGIETAIVPSVQNCGGLCMIDVTEGVWDAGFGAGNLVATSTLGIGDVSDPPAEPGDQLVIDPGLKKVWVVKDIGLTNNATNPNASVGVSLIFQRFEQTAVPEPTSLILLGSGLGALALFGWRRRK